MIDNKNTKNTNITSNLIDTTLLISLATAFFYFIGYTKDYFFLETYSLNISLFGLDSTTYIIKGFMGTIALLFNWIPLIVFFFIIKYIVQYLDKQKRIQAYFEKNVNFKFLYTFFILFIFYETVNNFAKDSIQEADLSKFGKKVNLVLKNDKNLNVILLRYKDNMFAFYQHNQHIGEPGKIHIIQKEQIESFNYEATLSF